MPHSSFQCIYRRLLNQSVNQNFMSPVFFCHILWRCYIRQINLFGNALPVALKVILDKMHSKGRHQNFGEIPYLYNVKIEPFTPSPSIFTDGFRLCTSSGVEITKYFSLSFVKMSKKFTRPALFLPVLDMQTDSVFQNFSLSFGKVSNIFTCPALFLPVLDRWTACNFHPCSSY